MITSRRSFLIGGAALIAAPAIVRATNLMPVRSIERFTSFNDSHFELSFQECILDRGKPVWHTLGSVPEAMAKRDVFNQMAFQMLRSPIRIPGVTRFIATRSAAEIMDIHAREMNVLLQKGSGVCGNPYYSRNFRGIPIEVIS